MSVSVRVANRRRVARTHPLVEQIGLKRLVALLVLVVAVALVYAFTMVSARGISYRISRELETQRRLREVERRLQVELNVLQAPERLEREGARLGLVPPSPRQMRVLP